MSRPWNRELGWSLHKNQLSQMDPCDVHCAIHSVINCIVKLVGRTSTVCKCCQFSSTGDGTIYHAGKAAVRTIDDVARLIECLKEFLFMYLFIFTLGIAYDLEGWQKLGLYRSQNSTNLYFSTLFIIWIFETTTTVFHHRCLTVSYICATW